MGLTKKSTGKNIKSSIYTDIQKKSNEKVIALAGNPNVGKSSIFNLITGMNQHTGNWPGKTVAYATGKKTYNNTDYIFVDLPGCYSLKSNSPEEEIARDFISSGMADMVVVVCDATALERNLNLALQIQELTDNVIICVNLMDEAKKKKISIDLSELSKELHTPVVGTVARNKKSAVSLLNAIESYPFSNKLPTDVQLKYPEYIETILSALSQDYSGSPKSNRVKAIEALEKNTLTLSGKTPSDINDDIIKTVCDKAQSIALKTVKNAPAFNTDLKIDKIVTGRLWGFAIMFCLLTVIFWLTIIGANYPTQLLSKLFLSAEPKLYDFLVYVKTPKIVCNMIVYGVYHILTWIISVMLPPMAIFFPLFTILEDIGYLPRIAFNLDRCFKNCSACGKQALTMCMGFGCNAAGVVGGRIIDSPRERLIAILTNSFVPCNGRFPAIISIITMFLVVGFSGFTNSLLSSLALTFFVMVGIITSLLISKFLSKTFLKGIPSAFTLELPPYRRPQFGKIIVRSIFDRTLFVLGRAITAAAPAGLIIWLASNIEINDLSVLAHISSTLDPLGKLMGLDGTILTAFIMGFPANEIVIPLIIMMYGSGTVLTEVGALSSVRELLVANGWTPVTAINTILFMLMHWPCATTCMTIKAETKSLKWTLLAIILPTICGIVLCIITNLLLK